MEHIHGLTAAHLEQPSLVTIGVFDGVHRGHQHLIGQLVREAHNHNQAAVVLTFFPHPAVVLRDIAERHYLTTPDERAHLLFDLGVDYVITHPFDDSVRHIRATDFVDQLLDHVQMQALWVGADFALGYKREGNVDFLRQQGEAKGFSVEALELLSNGSTISSTAIRQALQAGQVEQAAQWLGRAYTVAGKVVRGDQRGRKIGFPTANLAIWEQQIIPANGVYASWVWLNSERYMAATNVGVRPTFDGVTLTVEPYMLDFDREIYGETLRVSFEKRLRGEQKFNGISELVAQIGADAKASRAYLSDRR